jgi:hypothetical protein
MYIFLYQMQNIILYTSKKYIMATDYDVNTYNETRGRVSNIMNSLQTQLDNLTGNNNVNVTNVNLLNETLAKEQRIADNQSERMDEQLDKLKEIESTVNTKTRLLVDFNEASKKKDLYIYLLKFFISFIIYIVVTVVLMKFLHISAKFRLLTIGNSILGLLSYVGYLYYVSTLGDIHNDETRQTALKNQKNLQKFAMQQEQKKIKRDDNLTKVCGCPPPEQEEEDYGDNEEEYDTTIRPNNGFFYKDLSAPKQRYEPPVDVDTSPLEMQIEYPDTNNGPGQYQGGYPSGKPERKFYTVDL